MKWLLVYKIESGVPVQLLQDFLPSKFDRVCHLFSTDTLFKEESSLLKPYHDIYLNAFHKILFAEAAIGKYGFLLPRRTHALGQGAD